MKFSVIIPARNEQAFIADCLKSIHRAARSYPEQVQTIVVINRCSDDTEEISRSSDALFVTSMNQYGVRWEF
ncbi:glycosyltransferase [bacterium]|nr:glycosyltransferase [bacterium]